MYNFYDLISVCHTTEQTVNCFLSASHLKNFSHINNNTYEKSLCMINVFCRIEPMLVKSVFEFWHMRFDKPKPFPMFVRSVAFGGTM